MATHSIRPRPGPSANELPDPLQSLLADQDGVVSLAQVTRLGYSRSRVIAWQRRRLLAPVLPGVYLDHTGDPTWQQRAWAAVVYAAQRGDPRSAALSGESAIRAHEGPGRRSEDPQVIEVSVAAHRRVRSQPTVRVRSAAWLETDQVLWTSAPPRQRYEPALLEQAVVFLGQARHLDAVGLLARAVGARRTSASRLEKAMAVRLRTTQRSWLAAVLDDLRTGSCSVLEHGFRARVARPHRLPAFDYQVRAGASTGVIYRDAVLANRVVELDGRVGHSSTWSRERDFERDLDASLAGLATTRLSWGQVFDRPCVTAGKLARLLVADGWRGAPAPCSAQCAAPRVFAGG